MIREGVTDQARFAWPGPRRLARLGVWWVPAVAAAVYLVVFAARFGDIVAAGMRNADTASGPMMAELLGEAPPGREVLLGNFPWFTALWAQLGTAWVPAHRTVWEVGPYVVAVATFALVAAGAAAVTGRWAAGVVVMILVCGGRWTVANLGSWTLHGPGWLMVALAAWVAVVLARGLVTGAAHAGAPRHRRVVRLLGLVVAGALIGTGVASDPLMWIAAVLPLAVAGLAVAGWAARGVPRRRAWVELGVALVAIVAAAVATKVSMDAAGIHARDYPVHLVARDLIDHNINVLAHALAGLGNGDVSGLRWGPVKLAHLAGTGLTIAALAAVMWTAGREIAAAAVARAEGRADGCGTPVRTVWLTFWAVSATALAVSFVATTAPEGTYSNRYLVGVLLAVTAVLPLAVERSARARVLLAVGVAVFALIGVMSLLRGEMTNNPLRFPTRSTADALAAFARARGLAVGYAGYWDAPALTWSAGDDRLRVYPVTECAPEHRLCPPSFHRISTWYRPRPRTRTFLVLHPALSMEKPTAPDLQLGAPVAVDRVGPLTVYTYNYDIAARMGGVDPRLGAVTA